MGIGNDRWCATRYGGRRKGGTMTPGANADQSEFWNSRPGQNWVRHQVDLDAIHGRVTDLLMSACATSLGEKVLDVGCGAGASSFALAQSVGLAGHVHGIDISAPLVRRAEERKLELGIENVSFEIADAQDSRFEAGLVDLVASRFGLMFFSDPVAAFRNIASALRPGGRIVFVSWAGPEHNPWFAWPQRIAVARLGPVAPAPPDAPGPMAFRDTGRVLGILEAAGFVECTGETMTVDLHHPRGIGAVVELAAVVGPTARMLREKGGSAEDLAAITQAIAVEFEQFRSNDGIRIPAGVNMFMGRSH
jgi:SAM-dependent methyltransferase